MREIETIIRVLTCAFFFALFAMAVWAIYHWDLFPRQRLRNCPFSDISIGQVFYDYGGDQQQLREYVKTDELEARCLSIPARPLVGFDRKDVVKVAVPWW
jgi:hypothetical protein